MLKQVWLEWLRLQQHRETVEAANPSQYWMRNMCFPVINHLTNEMQENWSTTELPLLDNIWLQTKLLELQLSRENKYTGPLNMTWLVEIDFTTEVERRKARCGHMEHPLPSTLINTLDALPKDLYPNSNYCANLADLPCHYSFKWAQLFCTQACKNLSSCINGGRKAVMFGPSSFSEKQGY